MQDNDMAKGIAKAGERIGSGLAWLGFWIGLGLLLGSAPSVVFDGADTPAGQEAGDAGD